MAQVEMDWFYLCFENAAVGKQVNAKIFKQEIKTGMEMHGQRRDSVQFSRE